ncbi:MAG TPA: carbohydrate kinase family protein [Polyangia bacterium]
MPFDVVGFGESSVDLMCVMPRHPAPGEKLRLTAVESQGGGQVATAMVACARLGLTARYLGAVGDDDAGARTLRELRAAGVDVAGVRVVAGAASRQAVVLVDAAGERTVLWHGDERTRLGPADLDRERCCSGRVLHLDATMLAAAQAAAAWARAAGILVSLDLDTPAPGVEELIGLADLCVVPLAFACALTGAATAGAALRALAGRCPGQVAVTLGQGGALALDGGAEVHEPAFAVDVVDTTGCGDVFHAAAIAARLRGLTPRPFLRFANAAAALATRRLGARGACPTLAEVEALLATGVAR